MDKQEDDEENEKLSSCNFLFMKRVKRIKLKVKRDIFKRF